MRWVPFCFVLAGLLIGACSTGENLVLMEDVPPQVTDLRQDPSPTLVATPHSNPAPSLSPAPSPVIPTPVPQPILRQLTTGGCCTQPFWSADSRQVLFIDKPAPDQPTGIWGVAIDQPLAPPILVTERIAYYTPDFAYLIEVGGSTTIIERLADGDRWSVPAGGEPVYFSPQRQQIAWQVRNDAPFERRITQIWVAQMDGSNARVVATIPRGSFAGWISEDQLLLSGRETLQAHEQRYFALSLSSGTTVELARSERLRGALLSPDREWMAYFVTLAPDPAENGLWLVRTDGKERRQLDAQLFGAYQWQNARHLILVPLRYGAPSHEFWRYDLKNDTAWPLTDPTVTRFKIANGDWQVSPDGRHVAFVASHDRNIWIITWPDA